MTKISEKILLEVNASTTPMPAEDVSVKRLNGNSSDDSSKISPVAVSISFMLQVILSKKSRLLISILPEDPEEKRKHIIGLVLERFPYLSLSDNDERADRFNLDSLTLCPLCNGDHKEKSIWNDIKGEWGTDEYCSERTYCLECRNVYCGIPIVSVKAQTKTLSCGPDYLKCTVRYRENSCRRIGAVQRANRIYIPLFFFNSIWI